MKNNKQLLINFVATFFAFAVNALINFVLSSHIVSTVNEEAYGFVQLANTFINYFTVITLAVNSMASRFISFEYYKNNIKESEAYYSATFWANIFIIVISLPIIIIFVANLDCFIQISPELVKDVQLLFIFLAGNLYLNLLTTNLSVSFYIKNKLYIQSLINMISYILKAIILLVLYRYFSPLVAFVGLSTLIATTFIQLISLYYKKKLIPEIKIGKFSFEKTKILIKSGIWNSITRIGNILSEGLDLFITNIFLDASSMGILAIVKIIPNIISSVLSNLVTIFMPSMVKTYAKTPGKEFVQLVKKSMSFVGIFLNIPIVFVIVFGNTLFLLWFPTQDANILNILSIFSIIQWAVIGPVSIMHNVFTVINKIKVNSILVCITGFLNIVIVFILLKMTNWGIFAVVCISSLLSIIRNLLYTLPFSAKYIGCKWWTFFPEIIKSIVSVLVNVLLGFLIKILISPNNWSELFGCCIILAVISFIVNCLISLDKDDKKKLTNKTKKFLRRNLYA